MIKKLTFLTLVGVALIACKTEKKENESKDSPSQNETILLAQTPPMGWNSFDSYGVYLHEEAAMENLEAMTQKLKPFGYEFFVIDNGWFGEYKLQEGTNFSIEKHATDINIDKFGLIEPSKTYFPNGLKRIADRAHELGLKFGVHLMRGIPRKAYLLDTPIENTPYSARDIADTSSICKWCDYNYGVDTDKSGAQEFYNNLVNKMADYGVDFLKVDDIVPFPKEVEALVKAVAQAKRPMVLSLSPGGSVDVNAIGTFKKSNMLRVTPDIWDEQLGIDQCFDAWKKWTGSEQPGFWIDMDMIPFGQLQLMSPKPDNLNISHEVVKKLASLGKMDNVALLSGKGWSRQSELSKDQMFTFITMRAMAASPLMVGGDLPTLDNFSLSLLTNKEMLACNQNGVMGTLEIEDDGIEVWYTPKKGSKEGWLGIFNRTENPKSLNLKSLLKKVNIPMINNSLFNVWENKPLNLEETKNIEPNGVVFIKISA